MKSSKADPDVVRMSRFTAAMDMPSVRQLFDHRLQLLAHTTWNEPVW